MMRRDIQRVTDELQEELQRALQIAQFDGRGIEEREYDGHRVEIVDGEVSEQYLVDGEWMDKRAFLEEQRKDEEAEVYELSEDGLIFDLDGRVETGNIEGAIATLNNDVLSVEFIREKDE